MRPLFIVLFFLSFSGAIDAESLTKSKLTYELKAKQKWNKDYVTERPDQGKDHLVLDYDESIDILFSFGDEKLLSELNKQGLEKTLAQILNAKNTIQQLVSDDPVVLKNSKIENIGQGKKISLETDFTYGKKKYHTMEIYFLYESKVLHSVLRWNESSSAEKLELAKTDFMSINVDMK